MDDDPFDPSVLIYYLSGKWKVKLLNSEEERDIPGTFINS